MAKDTTILTSQGRCEIRKRGFCQVLEENAQDYYRWEIPLVGVKLQCSNGWGFFVFENVWHNKKKHLSFPVTFWSYRILFIDGLHFLAGKLSLMFALALVVKTWGFTEQHIAFKVPQSQGLLQVLGILDRWSNAVFQQICSVTNLFAPCMPSYNVWMKSTEGRPIMYAQT